MKKKISFILIVLLMILSLSACNLTFSNPDAEVNTIFSDDTKYHIIQTEITQTVEEVKKSCVGIYVEYGQGSDRVASVGSGVVYKMIDLETNVEATETSTDVLCYVITNEHVIDTEGNKNANYYVYLDNDDYVEASPVGSDATNDLAVLTFECSLEEYDLVATPLENEISYDDETTSSTNLPIAGNYCIAIGCPLSLDNFNYTTIGNISKVTQSNIMHSAAINPGNSGGALFNTMGQLIGINYQKNTIITEDNDIVPIEGMGYAIPIWTVREVVSDIESTGGEIERPLLGITITTINTTINPDEKDSLPNTAGDGKDLVQGIVVMEVSPNSNASRATSRDTSTVGLQVGDVIYQANGKTLSRNDDLAYQLHQMRKGETMNLVIFRQVDGNWYQYNYSVNLA